MKIIKMSSKFIKPHTPTPENLKKYSISVVDQLMGPINFGVVLFYESKQEIDSLQLQESLARILVEFYPLAGRYMKNDHMVDCSDQGAEFVEAEVIDVELVDLVAKIETDQLHALLPEPYFRADPTLLLSIQATRFPSGGLAIAVSVSHVVFDASSLGTFVAAWSAFAHPDRTAGFAPTFDIPSLLPHRDLGRGAASVAQFGTTDNDAFVVKRFWFKKGALESLKAGIVKNGGKKTVSGVRVVCAVIARALIGLDRSRRGRGRDAVVAQAINMRERTTFRPQPKHSCGNLFVASLTPRVADDIRIEELARVIGDSVRACIGGCAGMLSPDRDGRDAVVETIGAFVGEMSNAETNVIVFSDWSKFGFYEADFGWGKPIGTSVGPIRLPFDNMTVLMSDKEGDGIEAWVHLNPNDMRCFQQNEEIKLFTA